MTKLRRLRAVCFRGARFELPLDFTRDHRSIAIYGENASGKSTITDALEWFINNRVQHLWREGCKQDALRHVLCDDTESSQVEVHFSGKDFTGTKSLSHELKTKLSTDNEDFTALIDELTNDNIFLRHAQITRFLDDEKSKKREAIASIIGYDHITKFRAAIQSTRNALQNETTYKTAKSQLETHKTNSMELVGEFVTDKPAFYKKVNQLIKPFSIPTIITDDNTYQHAIKELQQSATDPQKIKTAQRLSQLQTACLTLSKELEAVFKAIKAFTDPYNQLAEEKENVGKIRIADFLTKGDQIIEQRLFTDPNCPFCLTNYDLETLQKEVQARLASITELQKKHDASKILKNTLDTAITTAKTRAQTIADDYADLDSFNQLSTDAKNAVTRMTAVSQTLNTNFDLLDSFTLDKAVFTSLKNLSALANTSAAAAKDQAHKLAMTAKEQALALMLTTLHQLYGAVTGYIKKNKLVKLYEAQIITLSTIFDDFVKIQNKALQAVLDIISRDVGTFYKKLHPKENIDEVHLTMVGDEGIEFQYNFHGNATQPPHKYLSESHLNSLGVVLFLANARIFNKQAKFLVLDDIVTSFDTGHRRRLLRLLKEEFSDWQIILLTHQQLWFDLIKAEMSESGWLFKEVQFDDENGIQLEKSAASFRALIDQKRNRHDVSNDLRKYLEATLKEICFALEVRVSFRFNEINEKRMSDELLSALRSTLNKKSPDLAASGIFSDLQGSNLISNIGSHNNKESIVGDDINVALEDIDKLTAIFLCNECGRFVEAQTSVPGDKKIACRCGDTTINWKT